LVFCVFDDDNKIEKFKQAISKAKENDFIPITSIPCFEVWFLLHYCYTTSPFNNYKQLLPKLEAEMRKKGILKQGEYYNKSDLELYKKLKIHQQDAVNHATRLEKDYPNEHGCNNPSTKVHTLVKKLQEQKEFK
ncbi:MAG: RloB family protein, partial [Trichormus sp.]